LTKIPILAVFGTQLENGLEIRDAAELRVKESDRIAAVVENLRRMNARVEEFPDGLRVEKSDLKGARIDSFGDHRIAMAFSVAALFAEGETEISGAECAAVSFPEFYEVLECRCEITVSKTIKKKAEKDKRKMEIKQEIEIFWFKNLLRYQFFQIPFFLAVLTDLRNI
jgi:hypothetical protein